MRRRMLAIAWIAMSAMNGEKSMPPMNGSARRIGARIGSVTLHAKSPRPQGSFIGTHESSTRAKIASVSACASTLMNASIKMMRKAMAYSFGRSSR